MINNNNNNNNDNNNNNNNNTIYIFIARIQIKNYLSMALYNN